MPRKSITITLSLRTPEQKEALEKTAQELGYLWGGKPNISGLLIAIAEGEVSVRSEKHSKTTIEGLKDQVARLDRTCARQSAELERLQPAKKLAEAVRYVMREGPLSLPHEH